jgi:hypothetical protein
MEPVHLRDPRTQIAAPSVAVLLHRFFPVYCLLAALVTFGYARYDTYQLDGDAVAYMDIGDLLRAHRWAGIVNGYWHPMYPLFLSLGHMLFRAGLATELRAYYFVNFAIFLIEMLAVVSFTDAIERLRNALSVAAVGDAANTQTGYLSDRTTLRYLGLALLVIASQRELSLGKVRPDALLQAFLLFALAALLTHLATNLLRYAALMGLALGCAYLTKSFAFLFAFLCILALSVFRWLWLKHKPASILPAALLALLCFAAIAGPYVAALSHQKGRLDFGDSGSLNYAWYVAGTEKMHLQPYQTAQFGSAEVHLKHPERELLHSPLVLSYAQLPYGTYPDWFDTTYWNDQIKPHFKISDDLPRAARNFVLVLRYLFNHPEALLLLGLLVALGARFTLRLRPRNDAVYGNTFWLVPLLLGVAIWGIYGLVNTEERYVTIAYLSIVLTLFAALRVSREDLSLQPATARLPPQCRDLQLPATASLLVLFLGLLAIGESLRIVLEDRRQLSIVQSPGGWYSAKMSHAAEGLASLGVKPGESVACVGEAACLTDHYWARLAGVRILTEIYDPNQPVAEFIDGLPSRNAVMAIVQAQGTSAVVGDFGRNPPKPSDEALRGWVQLGATTLYALPLKP